MHKLFSISLAILILFQGAIFDFEDLMDLGELVEHARFHSDTYGDNFVVFLSKHYGEMKQDHQRQHREEKEQHDQLPFGHQQCLHTPLVFVLTQYGSPLPSVPRFRKEQHNYYYQSLYHLVKACDIFQPPRTV